jgi:hypothetical protein
MTDTPPSPPGKPGDKALAIQLMDNYARQICELAKAWDLQAVVIIGRPTAAGDIETAVTTHASPGFRAAVGRKLMEAEDAAPLVDRQRIQEILDDIDVRQADGSITAAED